MLSIIDYLFLASLAVAVIWGLAALIIGFILRFNVGQFFDTFVADVDTSFYEQVSYQLVMMSKKLGDVDLGSWSNTLGSILIVIGVIILGFAIAGISAVIISNATALFVTIGLILLAFILEFIFLWLLVDVNNTFHADAKTSLQDKLSSEYQLGANADAFSKYLNSIMVAGHCCGIDGVQDFKNISVVVAGMTYEFRHSPACCLRPVWDSAESDASGIYLLSNCIADTGYNIQGCYEAVFNSVKKNSGVLIIAVIAILMISEAVVGGLAVCELFRVETDEEHRRDKKAEKVKEEAVEEVKQFTPYSKLSSYQTEDVSRIRSTEVW